VSDPTTFVKAKAFILRYPVLVIAIVGIVIRACLIPLFTYSYDIYHWAVTISNLRSGEGLYGLPGYYYTPVWGYMLAGIGNIADILGIANFGSLDPSLTFVADSEWPYYREMTYSLAFTILIKTLFTIFDLITAYLIYVLVKDHTKDTKKASAAFGLWFLCPIVIYTSSVHAMFDTIAVTALVLTLLLILRQKYALAGMVFAISVFLKFFPAYLIFILFALILRQGQTAGNRNKAALTAVSGFLLMTILIYIPQIIDGTVLDSFNFISSRVGEIGANNNGQTVDIISTIGYSLVITLQAITFPILIFLSWKIYKTPEKDEAFASKYMLFLMLSSAVIFLWTPTPTYLMIILPFLVYVSVTRNDKYIIPYILISVSAVLYSLAMHNYSLLFQLYEYSNLIPLDFLINGIGWLDMRMTFISNRTIINIILGAAETLSIYSIYLFAYKAHKRDKKAVMHT